MAVLVGIADAQLAAISQLNASRTLDLQELQVHGVGQPGNDRCLYAIGFDGGRIVVRLEHATFEAAAQAFALELRVEAVQRHDDHVLRYAVHRDIRCGGLGEAAGVDRLVIAGNQAVGAVVPRAQAIHVQVLFQEVAYSHGGLRHFGRCCTGRAPGRIGLEPGACAAPGTETGQQVCIGHRWQRLPGCADIGGEGVGLRFLDLFAAITTGQQGDQR